MNRLLLFIVLCILSTGVLCAQKVNSDGVRDIDPEVYEYYKRCEKAKNSPDVLAMSDTLYSMAEAKGDKRTMCTALCFKPQYYLANNETDSAEKYVAFCKQMSRRLGQPKFYYYIWNRQIQSLLAYHYRATAMEHLRLMQEEAAKEQSPEGITECYRALAQIYNEQHMNERALEYNTKLIDYIEKNNVDDYNYMTNIARQIDILTNLRRFDEAEQYIEKGRKLATREFQMISLLSSEVCYYSSKNDFVNAESKVKELEEALKGGTIRRDAYCAIAYYYYHRKQYDKAVEVFDFLRDRVGRKTLPRRLYINSLLRVPGRLEEAIMMNDEVLAEFDSVRAIEQSTALAEFSTLMDKQRLEEENAQMQLTRSRYITLTLVVIIILLIVIAISQMIYKTRTKESQRKLDSLASSKQAIEADVAAAGKIQAQMIPNVFPAFPSREEFSLYATMRPAKMIGGDYYDYFMIGDKLYFIIGDVSGKGIPASLIMSLVCSTFRTFSRTETDIRQIVKTINTSIGHNNQSNMFTTLLAGVLDTRTGELTLCNSGHDLPFLVKDDHVTLIEMESGMPLGLFEHDDFPVRSFMMVPGDKIVAYTDGITEAENESHEQFGVERLQQILAQYSFMDSTGLTQMLTKEVDHFVGEAVQSDDLTILSLQLLYYYR